MDNNIDKFQYNKKKSKFFRSEEGAFWKKQQNFEVIRQIRLGKGRTIQTKTKASNWTLRELKAEESCRQVIELTGESQLRINCFRVTHCCCRSVPQSCPPLSDPEYCSVSGFPVLSHLPVCSNSHTRCHRTISDANQPSHPLSSPSPPVFNLSQNQGIF